MSKIWSVPWDANWQLETPWFLLLKCIICKTTKERGFPMYQEVLHKHFSGQATMTQRRLNQAKSEWRLFTRWYIQLKEKHDCTQKEVKKQKAIKSNKYDKLAIGLKFTVKVNTKATNKSNTNWRTEVPLNFCFRASLNHRPTDEPTSTPAMPLKPIWSKVLVIYL